MSMSAFSKTCRITLSCIGLIFVAGCSAVHIETGPPTREEKTQTSTERGKDIRSDFANRLSDASPIEKAHMVKTFMDSVCARYIGYGFQVVDNWHNASEQSGREVSDTEMRQAVESSIQTDKPMLDSYDDIVEYGLEQIRETYYLDESTEQLLNDFRDHYYHVRSFVFIPTGSVQDYEDGLYGLRKDTNELSGHLAEDLRRY